MRAVTRRSLRLAAIATTLSVAACTAGTPASAPPSSAAPSATNASTELVADFAVGGDRTQRLVCLGPTDLHEPVIVLEAGLGGPYQAWSEILGPMSTAHRVCAYDRAGLGNSPPAGGDPRTAEDVATDLHAMLTAAGVGGPFVLVGHSFGALPISLYAATHPTEVLGVVLIDPRGPRVSGGWVAALPPVAGGEPDAVAANRHELATFEDDPSLNDEHIDLAASAAEVIAALDADGPLFGETPVTVLRASDTPDGWADLPPDIAAAFDEVWFAGQLEFADESEAGELVTVEESGHEMQFEQPQAVIKAIEAMLADVAGN